MILIVHLQAALLWLVSSFCKTFSIDSIRLYPVKSKDESIPMQASTTDSFTAIRWTVLAFSNILPYLFFSRNIQIESPEAAWSRIPGLYAFVKSTYFSVCRFFSLRVTKREHISSMHSQISVEPMGIEPMTSRVWALEMVKIYRKGAGSGFWTRGFHPNITQNSSWRQILLLFFLLIIVLSCELLQFQEKFP